MRLIPHAPFVAGLAAVLSTISAVQAKAALGIKGGKVTVLTGGVEDASYSLSPPTPLPPIQLTEKSSLKLSFTTIDTSTGSAIQPRNAQLLFESSDGSGKKSAVPVGVKANGKGSYVLNLSNTLPFALSPNLNLTLLLSSLPPSGPGPFAYPLGSISLPPSLHADSSQQRRKSKGGAGSTYPAFEVEEEIYPQMPVPEKEVGLILGWLGVGVVSAPWVVLLGIYSRLAPSLSLTSPSPITALFLFSLFSLEALFVTYWACLKLYHLLPALAGMGLGAAWLGKEALRKSRV